MTIKDAIERLQQVAHQYGDDAPVYFDCPRCGQSHEPTVIITKAVHLAAPRA